MALKITLWASALLFAATIWNVASAYNEMGGVNVQSRFQEIGLLDNPAYAKAEFPLPPRKPLLVQEVASYQ